ncbi:MAG: hypothetical protein ABI036_02625 [Fibrobacteria bacterium]
MRLFSMLLLLCLTVDRGSAAPAVVAADLTITGNVLQYKGHALRFFDRIQTWQAAFGEPSGKREIGANHAYAWDSAGLELYAVYTPDGREYVTSLRVRLNRCRVSLFGSALTPPVRYREIQHALPANPTFEDGPGSSLVSGSLPLRSPDGFRAWVSADLRCNPNGPDPEPIRYIGHIPVPRKSKADECEFIFDEIEISAAGDMGWQ